jgi:hypothetical protein
VRFDDRTYPDIVRDLLTHLTEGVAGEPVMVDDLGGGAVPDRFEVQQKPIRRVSHVMGKIAGRDDEEVDYRFTERDFELLPSEGDPSIYVGIRLRPRAPRPIAGTYLIVNYYPLRTAKTPISDVNVGSVARTLLETVAREIATQYMQLQRVYDSAFVETSEGRSLDKVAALVDTRRITRGHPIGKVRFTRRQGAAGAIHVPAKTAVTDGQGSRYLTSEDALLEPTQSTVEVWVHGETVGTPIVDAGGLNVIERAIAGVDRVSNEEATWAASSDERDDAFAARARRAIHAAGKGTLDALRFGIEGLPFVSAVALGEYDGTPNSPVAMPGMLRIDVALTQDNALNRALVDKKIRELRPAGIWVERTWAEPIAIAFSLTLTLTGSGLASSELEAVKQGVRDRLSDFVAGVGPGQVIRQARLISLVLQDDRIADVTLTLQAGGQAISDAIWTVPTGKTAQLDSDAPFTFASPIYEDQPDTSAVTLVYVDAAVKVQQLAITVTDVEKALKPKLEALLGQLQPNANLTFSDVLDVLRDSAESAAHGQGTEATGAVRWVIAANDTVLTLEIEGGSFGELDRAGGYTVPPATSLVLRRLDVEVLAPV